MCVRQGIVRNDNHTGIRIHHIVHTTTKEKLISLIKFSTPYRNLFIVSKTQWNVIRQQHKRIEKRIRYDMMYGRKSYSLIHVQV